MNKLNIKVRSGLSADGFETSITKDGRTSGQTTWSYGYNCSHDRMFATKDEPYVTDILQKLIDDNQVDAMDVAAGNNVFATRSVENQKVEDFKDKFCNGLKFPNTEKSFEDAVASIPADRMSIEQ